MLAFPSPQAKLEIVTDASASAAGEVLLQIIDGKKNQLLLSQESLLTVNQESPLLIVNFWQYF